MLQPLSLFPAMQHLSLEEHGAVSRYLCGRDTLKVYTLCHLALSEQLLGQLRRCAWRNMSEAAHVHYLAFYFYTWRYDAEWSSFLHAYWCGGDDEQD